MWAWHADKVGVRGVVGVSSSIFKRYKPHFKLYNPEFLVSQLYPMALFRTGPKKLSLPLLYIDFRDFIIYFSKYLQ